ncbi:hypothetical protein [Prochlorothrix hollandica]|nr:hypothetical protein [Prochlorothrix hollandica]
MVIVRNCCFGDRSRSGSQLVAQPFTVATARHGTSQYTNDRFCCA